jgi:hypothetical protein
MIMFLLSHIMYSMKKLKKYVFLAVVDVQILRGEMSVFYGSE